MSKIRTVADFPRNAPGLVDNFIGTAYDVVKKVHDNLDEIGQVADALENLPTLAQDAVDEALDAKMPAVESTLQVYVDAAAERANQAGTSANASAASAAEAAQTAAAFNALTSITPAPGKIPVADTGGKLAEGWFTGIFARLSDLASATGATLVGYAHAYTGAITRSIADRFKTHVDIMDFGVVTGMVSYTEAEQNLIKINKASEYAASIGAGLLRFPQDIVCVRRTPGNDGTDPGDAALLLRSDLAFIGKSKRGTRIVRMGPTTLFSVRPGDKVTGAAIRNMTIDGNPGIEGYTHYAANLVYLEDCNDVVVDNVVLKDVPGLHALDVNGVEGLTVTRTDFLGYDLSLRGEDTTYYPESIQIGTNPSNTRISKRIRIHACTAGPSENYQAPLVVVGNHSGGGGGPAHACEDLVVQDMVAKDVSTYLFRLKAWKNVKLLGNRLESGTARFAYLDFKPAYPEAGTTFAACEDVLIADNYHNGDGEFIYTNIMSDTVDPVVRYRDIRVVGGEVVGRAATNGISLFHTTNFTVTNLKSRGCRRHLAAYWSDNVKIVNPDWDGAEVNGVEFTDRTGYANGLGYGKNLSIQGGKITGSKTYGLYIGATNGYLIDGLDVSGSASLAGTQNAIHIFGASSNGVIRDVVGRDVGNAFSPVIGVNITSGANHVVENVDIFCTGAMVANAGTLNSYENRRTIYRSSVPTTGTWRAGTVCRNTNPTTGGVIEWLCTVGGTPGTWVPLRTLSGPVGIGVYTLTTLPSAALNPNTLIIVSNATGGAKVCMSNGTNWLILNTTTPVS